MLKNINFDIVPPCECTDDEFKEWIYFQFGIICSISEDNPLCEIDIELNSVNSISIS